MLDRLMAYREQTGRRREIEQTKAKKAKKARATAAA
jgi:hypothetical protein